MLCCYGDGVDSLPDVAERWALLESLAAHLGTMARRSYGNDGTAISCARKQVHSKSCGGSLSSFFDFDVRVFI
jgi:hypothetical protein